MGASPGLWPHANIVGILKGMRLYVDCFFAFIYLYVPGYACGGQEMTCRTCALSLHGSWVWFLPSGLAGRAILAWDLLKVSLVRLKLSRSCILGESSPIGRCHSYAYIFMLVICCVWRWYFFPYLIIACCQGYWPFRKSVPGWEHWIIHAPKSLSFETLQTCQW